MRLLPRARAAQVAYRRLQVGDTGLLVCRVAVKRSAGLVGGQGGRCDVKDVNGGAAGGGSRGGRPGRSHLEQQLRLFFELLLQLLDFHPHFNILLQGGSAVARRIPLENALQLVEPQLEGKHLLPQIGDELQGGVKAAEEGCEWQGRAAATRRSRRRTSSSSSAGGLCPALLCSWLLSLFGAGSACDPIVRVERATHLFLVAHSADG